MPLILILQSAEEPRYQEVLQGFRSVLEDKLGPDGTAFRLVVRTLSSEGGIPQIKPEQQPITLFVALGEEATLAARHMAEGRPVIFAMVSGRAARELLESGEEAPLTGVMMDVSLEGQLETLTRVLPNARRVGVMHQASATPRLERAREAASSYGLELVNVSVQSGDQIPSALLNLTGKIDALWMPEELSAQGSDLAQFLTLHALRHRLPFMAVAPGHVKAGALFCAYADYEEMGRQTAELVHDVVSGRSLTGIPPLSPRRWRIALNLKAAEAIGQSIPREIRKEADPKF
ncbi:MAG: ABC transporter substrate binding protein [Acidobacteriota bacterium]